MRHMSGPAFAETCLDGCAHMPDMVMVSLTEDSQDTWLSFAGLKDFQAVALLLESR